jgi:hypothetical protein
VVSFDERNTSIVWNDYLDAYSYELWALPFPPELGKLLTSGSDVLVEAPGVAVTLPTREGAAEASKFVEACELSQ